MPYPVVNVVRASPGDEPLRGFADGTAFYGGSWNGVSGSGNGLLYGVRGRFVAQLICCLTLVIWAFGVSWVFFNILDLIMGMRVSPQLELEGLDVPESVVLGTPTSP
jgi:Amt family ammonium transporter